MTVGELIELLAEKKPSRDVKLRRYDGDGDYYTIGINWVYTDDDGAVIIE